MNRTPQTRPPARIYTDPSYHKAAINQALKRPVADILANGRTA